MKFNHPIFIQAGNVYFILVIDGKLWIASVPSAEMVQPYAQNALARFGMLHR